LSIILGVIGVNIVVQIIDNILVPLIINTNSNKCVRLHYRNHIRRWCRIAGMFLAIPILAILKIIFDRIESLEAWGYLMGDNLPKNFIWKK
jgi:predicted PurR-regulated permease PerM